VMHDKECRCVECCLLLLDAEKLPSKKPREKLIRNKIPEIIRSGGQPFSVDVHYRKAEPEEMQSLLVAKLHEEVKEYVTSYDPDELADIMEVVLALSDLHGFSERRLEHIRLDKVDERGDFTDRFVLFLK
jgi:predicted house-cleaning noncanonical NTP pyrophosphatase (MazG superfamily)